MKRIIRNNQSGFTLIEMLIVVVILAIVVGMTSDMLMSLIRSNTKTQVINEIEQQANFVSLKIEKELRDADLVNTSSYDSNCLEHLCLKFRRRDGKNITYKLVPVDGTSPVAYKLQRSLEGFSGGDFLDVTNAAPIGGVLISCISADNCFEIIGSSPQVVKINMIFNQSQQDAGASYKGNVKIESSIVIRSTY
jgi:prepilin-type N-terminal cleavage/methylation domain-containing protein